MIKVHRGGELALRAQRRSAAFLALGNRPARGPPRCILPAEVFGAAFDVGVHEDHVGLASVPHFHQPRSEHRRIQLTRSQQQRRTIEIVFAGRRLAELCSIRRNDSRLKLVH